MPGKIIRSTGKYAVIKEKGKIKVVKNIVHFKLK